MRFGRIVAGSSSSLTGASENLSTTADISHVHEIRGLDSSMKSSLVEVWVLTANVVGVATVICIHRSRALAFCN